MNFWTDITARFREVIRRIFTQREEVAMPPIQTPSVNRLPANRDPRTLIFKIFEEELPIRGGWGYSKEDAVVIDKHDPSVNPRLPFHGVGIERQFVLNRLQLELITALPQEESYADIKWELIRQSVHQDGGRTFDCLRCEAFALRYLDWLALKDEWEGPNGYGSKGFDEETHFKKRRDLTFRFECEYWFEITSFFGKSV